MDASKKLGENSPSANKRAKTDVAKEGSSKETTRKHYWKSGLSQAINDADNIVESSDTLVIIKDKYPKVNIAVQLCPSSFPRQRLNS